MKKIINFLFVGSIVLFLLMGLINTLFFPEDINYLENRSANKVGTFTLEKYLDGVYQKEFSNALNDQVPLQGRMKKTYNYLNSFYEKVMVSKTFGDESGRYISFKDGLLFEDSIVYEPSDLEVIKQNLDNKVQNIDTKVKEHPNVDFYVYYIEKDTDIDFETNNKIGAFEYLSEKFQKQNIPVAGLKINNFDDFKKDFYKTDHHWNCYGSYRGYTEVMKMLNMDDEILEPENEIVLKDYVLSGSKAAGIGVTGIFTESFPVYQFQYPQMDIKIDGEKAVDYGKQQEYINGKTNGKEISYGEFYGWDNGEIVFDTHNTEKENLLVIGESYDNAILKLLASHFEKTFSIDLRNYERTFGSKFQFSQYVKDNNIDKVMLIGNIDYFTMDEFMLED